AMLNDPESYNFEGESKDLSVLFSDIRGFTEISEALDASQLKTLLNNIFTPITGIIFDHKGTIDKYVGDMVMAFWGAPLDDPEHHSNAVRSALKMLDQIEKLKPEFVARGLPEVSIGVGINSGYMNVGDMGSTYRRAYTVLGDAVNLSSRLESLTKFYQVKLLIGEATYDQIEGFLCRQVDKVQVKGKETSVRIYQPLCQENEASEVLLRLVAEYHQAYQKYLNQDWEGAIEMFTELNIKDPETSLYSLYLDRIAVLRQQVLEEGWDGTFRHSEK
ncbi:adenylate/guanylate cyclase domain-containing protein, partial [Gammaproteobacteria bacterium]|nr:adenylate/guanylate cyclase domain-containing protein [Gammaproteobacteria bacterium]